MVSSFLVTRTSHFFFFLKRAWQSLQLGKRDWETCCSMVHGGGDGGSQSGFLLGTELREIDFIHIHVHAQNVLPSSHYSVFFFSLVKKQEEK